MTNDELDKIGKEIEKRPIGGFNYPGEICSEDCGHSIGGRCSVICKRFKKKMIKGNVIRAGTMTVDGEELTGLVVGLDKKTMKECPFNLLRAEITIKENKETHEIRFHQGIKHMICNTSNKIRSDYKIYLEPELATVGNLAAQKIGCVTRSKYIRYSLINQLTRDGFQLSEKFKPFVNRVLLRGITHKSWL